MTFKKNMEKVLIVVLLISVFVILAQSYDISSPNSNVNDKTNNSTTDISPLSLVPQDAGVIGYYNGNQTIESDTIEKISDLALSRGLINEPTNYFASNTDINKYNDLIDSVGIYKSFDGNSTSIAKIRDLNIVIKSDISESEMESILDNMYNIDKSNIDENTTQLQISLGEQQTTAYYRRFQIQNNTFHIFARSISEINSITVHNNSLSGIKKGNIRFRVLDIRNAQTISPLVDESSVSISIARYTKYDQTTVLNLSFNNKSVAESFSQRLDLGVSYLSLLAQTEYNITSNAFALTTIERSGKTVSISYRGDYGELYESISKVNIERVIPD